MTRMAIVVSPRMAHQRQAGELMQKGVRILGDRADVLSVGSEVSSEYDVICTWGWHSGMMLRQSEGRPVLLMERAYLLDRYYWISLGWNGLNGRATFPKVKDGGERWRSYFKHLMTPWRINTVGYALILGQVRTDMAVKHIDFNGWVFDVANRLQKANWPVKYRAHPHSHWALPSHNIEVLRSGTLVEALEGAVFTVAFNSNSAVDAVLNGTPTVTLDEGSMAWDVTSHDLDHPLLCPEREEWAHALAWKQWLPKEIADGFAWKHLKEAQPK